MQFISHLPKRLSLFVALIALLCASSVMTVNAQAPNCFSLGAADCQLVAAADKNIPQETSASLTVETSLNMITSAQTINLSATGSGLFAVDSAVLSTASDQTAAFNALKLSLNMSGSYKITGTNSPSSLTGKANFVVLDGQVYTQATDSSGLLTRWQSNSLSQYTTSVNNSLNGTGTTGSVDGTTNPTLNLFQDPAFIQALISVPTIKGFIKGKKTSNAPLLEGQRQTELVYTFDVRTLITSPTIYPVLKALLTATGSDYSKATNAELQTITTNLATLIQGSTFKVTRWIGTKDKLYHALGIDGTLKVSNPAAQSGSITFHVLIKMSQIGQSITVTAPISDGQAAGSNTTPPNNAVPNANPTSIPSTSAIDAFIPNTALTRYTGIPFGKTQSSAYPAAFASLGDPNAPLKITQLSSYSCSYCENYYSTVIVNLLPQIKAGQIYYVFIPVTLTGEFDAKPGTAAALCALDQNKFWEMHDVLFNWQLRYGSGAADTQRLGVAALKLGLDITKFDACLTSPATVQKISAANKYFDTLGLNSTPSILINGKPTTTPPTLNDILSLISNSTPQATAAPGMTAAPGTTAKLITAS